MFPMYGLTISRVENGYTVVVPPKRNGPDCFARHSGARMFVFATKAEALKHIEDNVDSVQPFDSEDVLRTIPVGSVGGLA